MAAVVHLRKSVYCGAEQSGARIVRDGKQLAYIGRQRVANVAFGYGNDANLLCVTSGKSLCTMRILKQGDHLEG